MEKRERLAYRQKQPTLLEDLKRCLSPQLLDLIHNEIVQERCKFQTKKSHPPKRYNSFWSNEQEGMAKKWKE